MDMGNGSSIGCLAFTIRIQICILIRTHVLRAKHSCFRLSVHVREERRNTPLSDLFFSDCLLR